MGRLEELEQLEREATPGPWRKRARYANVVERQVCFETEDANGDLVSFTSWMEENQQMHLFSTVIRTVKQADADVRLIAILRNAAPALIRVAKAAKAHAATIDLSDYGAAAQELDAALAALEAPP